MNLRRAARLSLLDFCQYTYPGYEAAAHLVQLCEALEQVESGAIKRLMVNMPPRHGKSLTTSQLFPAWLLGRNPDWRLIVASYAFGLAASFSRRVRNLIDDSRYQHVFPGVQLAQDYRSTNAWDVRRHRGGMIAAGTRGGITGHGANVLIIDDPIKDVEEANSPAMREKVWEWYTATAYTRLAPDARVVLVQTRWHKDDLGGRILATKLSEYERVPWTVIRMPAINEAGEALWPAKYPLPALLDIKGTMAEVMWLALYQNDPILRTGALFRRQWFPIMDAAPATGRTVRYWDLAATEQQGKADPDWTVGAKLLFNDGVWTILDIVRARETPLQVEKLVVQTAQLDGRATTIVMEQEPGASGVGAIARYRQLLAGYTFRGHRPELAKAQRWGPLSTQAESGNIRLVKGAWNQAYLEELELAPNGAHDDMIDATTGAFEALTNWGIGFG